MATIPQTHRAVVVVEKGKITVKEKALPTLHDGTVLIKVIAVSVNPTDYKHVDDVLAPGASVGMDFAGDIVAIGAGVDGFSIGDAVAGFVRGGFDDPDNAAFQEYVRADPALIWHKPAKVIKKDSKTSETSEEDFTYEQAASMGGIILSTPVQALYHRLKLPPPWAPAKEAFPIIIWSGATSVGQHAITLAKLSGLKVATTASPKNHKLLEDLGASIVVDYRNGAKAVEEIHKWSEGRITAGLDCVGESGSTFYSTLCFGKEGGKLITLRPIPERTSEWPDNVEVERVFIYTALKKGSQDYKDIAAWYKELPALIKDGRLPPIKTLKHWDGGFDGFESALKYLKDGRASAEKFTLTL